MKNLNTITGLLLCLTLCYCSKAPGKEDQKQDDINDEVIFASADASEVSIIGLIPKFFYEVGGYAGTGTAGSANGQRQGASFNLVQGLAFDRKGNLYIADALNHKIRKISANGIVSTFAGSGNAGSADGPALSAEFLQPECVTVDAAGNVYVTDFNNKIRKISVNGMVSTFAGSGEYGSADGPANSASFKFVKHMAFDKSGNMYVTDSQGYKVRKISPHGYVSTYAGTGQDGGKDGPALTATFLEPIGIVLDDLGNVYVSDGNHKIRKISRNGYVSTYAGSGRIGAGDGTSYWASFYLPAALAIDEDNNIYVSDMGNYKVRKINRLGFVTTIAGTGRRGTTNGPGYRATFDGPAGIALNSSGRIFVGDAYANTVRVIVPRFSNGGSGNFALD